MFVFLIKFNQIFYSPRKLFNSVVSISIKKSSGRIDLYIFMVPPIIILALWARIEKKNRFNSHLIIHFPTSEGMSEVSERANERTDERVAQ